MCAAVSPSRLRSHEQQHPQSDPLMEHTVLHRHGHDETSDEEHVGILEVRCADFLGTEHTQEREHDQGEEGSDRQWHNFSHPIHCHHQNTVSTPALLKGIRYKVSIEQ